jgi:hypothetical protein
MIELLIEPGSEDYRLLKDRILREEPVVINVDPAWSEPMFVHGDEVTVEFDNGRGSATVDRTFTSDGTEYVAVTYGPGGKYRTSLPRSSVQTDRRREYPLRIEVR